MLHAHKYIQHNFDILQSGDVIDVAHILGETTKPRRSNNPATYKGLGKIWKIPLQLHLLVEADDELSASRKARKWFHSQRAVDIREGKPELLEN
jgi:hypothetical protein